MPATQLPLSCLTWKRLGDTLVNPLPVQVFFVVHRTLARFYPSFHWDATYMASQTYNTNCRNFLACLILNSFPHFILLNLWNEGLNVGMWCVISSNFSFSMMAEFNSCLGPNIDHKWFCSDKIISLIYNTAHFCYSLFFYCWKSGCE